MRNLITLITAVFLIQACGDSCKTDEQKETKHCKAKVEEAEKAEVAATDENGDPIVAEVDEAGNPVASETAPKTDVVEVDENGKEVVEEVEKHLAMELTDSTLPKSVTEIYAATMINGATYMIAIVSEEKKLVKILDGKMSTHSFGDIWVGSSYSQLASNSDELYLYNGNGKVYKIDLDTLEFGIGIGISSAATYGFYQDGGRLHTLNSNYVTTYGKSGSLIEEVTAENLKDYASHFMFDGTYFWKYHTDNKTILQLDDEFEIIYEFSVGALDPKRNSKLMFDGTDMYAAGCADACYLTKIKIIEE